MQDPNPLPWGAQDRFQAHFIVQKDIGEKLLNLTARTRLQTIHFHGVHRIGSKHILLYRKILVKNY